MSRWTLTPAAVAAAAAIAPAAARDDPVRRGRTGAAPDLATVAAAGIPGFDTSGWFGLLAPAGTPGGVIADLAGAATAPAKAPEVIARCARCESGGSPKGVLGVRASDIAMWSRLAA